MTKGIDYADLHNRRPPRNTEAVSRYWDRFYVDEKSQSCVLCGMSGIIDTRPTADTPSRQEWCICPNGQVARWSRWPDTPEESRKKLE